MGKRPSRQEIDELRQQQHEQQHRQWWDYGRRVASALAAGIEPPDADTHVFGPVLQPNERLRLFTDAQYGRRGWLSFWYGGVTEYHPNLAQWSATFAFEDTSPLMLSGPAIPGIIAWTAPHILGTRWLRDPRLVPLLAV